MTRRAWFVLALLLASAGCGPSHDEMAERRAIWRHGYTTGWARGEAFATSDSADAARLNALADSLSAEAEWVRR